MKHTFRVLTFLGVVLLLGGEARPAPAQNFLNKSLDKWARELDASHPPQVRRGAAFALGKMGAAATPELPRLVRALKDRDPLVQEAVASAIGEIGFALANPHIEAIKARTARPDDPVARQDEERAGEECAQAWGVVGPGLLQLLNDVKDPSLRRSVASAVGSYGPSAGPARPALVNALRDRDAGVRQNAAWALGRLGHAAGVEGVKSLSQALGDDDPVVRRDAAAALGSIGRPTAASAISALADRCRRDSDSGVRKAAVDAVLNLAGKEHRALAPELRPLLDHADLDVARGAALALGNIGGPDAAPAVPILRQALRDEDPTVKSLAAGALVNVGREAAPAVPELSAVLTDPDPSVRRNAALALGRIGPPARSAIANLAQALRADEPNSEVRRFAAEALAQIGQNTQDFEQFRAIEAELIAKALPSLLKAIQHDKDPLVRQRSVWTLFNLRDLEKARVVGPLTNVLHEKTTDSLMVRYDAARCLGLRLKDRAPDKAVAVLHEMLHDRNIKIYHGTGAEVSGSSEGSGGDARLKVDTGIDARYLAAEALASIGGAKANKPEIIEAVNQYIQHLNKHIAELEAAHSASDEPTRRAATETLPLVKEALGKTTKALATIQGR